ncbi:DUF350 domain-containing protein [Aneurinibacillus aneurinilyticus]|nr:DUF350 domain-containing protein [Aneurinibacillus aneurinilyticus]MED0731699.1 DUF350 domain-containing protein [Aneurinibacillus aneurinilyticus]MED0742011.1 DUF350 domain-containing protein [Aneurinibacillus aneurinilyticus]
MVYEKRRAELYGPLREEGIFTWDWMYGEEYALADIHQITAQEHEELAKATECLGRVFARTASVVCRGSSKLLAELGIPKEAWQAVRRFVWDDVPTVIGRFDFAQTPKGWKMLELNSDTPTGIVERRCRMASQWDNILNFLLYLAVTLPLLGFGMLVFLFTTPYKEYALIREGADTSDPQKQGAAKAAAHDLGGKIIGLSIVLASAIYHSVNLFDLVIWGIVAIVFQVLVFYLFELVTPFRVISEIPKGNVAVGLFASRLSIATGLLMAALISY